MVITKTNPWIGLNPLSRIRVKESINANYNAYWVIDAQNQYGLMIQFDKDFIAPNRSIKLNGIQVLLDDSSVPNKLILILNDMKDWEIFLILCNDLIDEMKEQDEDVITNVLMRLERWQKLLQKKTSKIFSKEEQMGLFSELKVLRDYIVPKRGWTNGIHGWVGSLGDKQDFLLENAAIEVKSYRISSGNTIWISSKEQLNSDKKPLYLLACALYEGESGETVDDLVQSIERQIGSKDLLIEFLEKVDRYGYIPEIHKDTLSKFGMEQISGFEVREGFPKLSLNQVSPWINQIKYSIDLTGCSDYKVNIDTIF
ncbi:PD-(D/E)XK motif protein [Aquibacillus halophilus]|nr:PD-(D/E)XK motif protein [Aquibacillus halophilus]